MPSHRGVRFYKDDRVNLLKVDLDTILRCFADEDKLHLQRTRVESALVDNGGGGSVQAETVTFLPQFLQQRFGLLQVLGFFVFAAFDIEAPNADLAIAKFQVPAEAEEAENV